MNEYGQALTELRAWAERSPSRFFEVRFLNASGSRHQWVARVENIDTSWSHESDPCERIQDAARACIREAAEQGMH